jgi:hypothetical protein
MRRAIYEWSALFSIFFAVTCVAYWSVSISSKIGDFKLSIGHNYLRMDFLATKGSLTICSDIYNLSTISEHERGIPLTPAPTGSAHCTLPGFKFYRLAFGSDPSVWVIRVNFLLLFGILSAISALCIWRYRRLRKPL